MSESPPASRSRQTAADMMRTMAVVVAAVVGLLLLVPRTTGITQPDVDPVAAASAAAARLGFTPAVPDRLPAGWNARSAEAFREPDGIETWHLTYLTPGDRYAGVQQAKDATAEWETLQVTSGPENGVHRVAGRDWVVRSRPDRGVTSWVLRSPGLTTVVTGTATQAELDVLAASLTSLPAA